MNRTPRNLSHPSVLHPYRIGDFDRFIGLEAAQSFILQSDMIQKYWRIFNLTSSAHPFQETWLQTITKML